MPTSQKRIDANRANSLKSTGPRTPEGRRRSSLNSVTHGLRSTQITLSRAEDCSDFDQRMDEVIASVGRRNALQALLLAKCVQTSWMHDRCLHA